MKLADLESLVDEARRLLGAHDGIHDMHGACCGMADWLRLARQDGCVKDEFVPKIETLIGKMRRCAATGFYPKHQS